MHIPDGFLTVKVWVSAWLVSIFGIGYCLKKTSRDLKDKMIPLMGVMSAFILAAQMLNFPIFGGTSGHLLGGVLAAVLLGPYAAALVLTSVLIVQCLLFQDGGLTALGANILNMAIVGSMGGYSIYAMVRKASGNSRGIVLGSVVASWLAVVAAASLCAWELAVSGISGLKMILLPMAGIYMFIAAVEAIITGMVIEFILKVRPDLIYGFKE